MTSMGDNLVLLQSEIPGQIEKARKEHVDWWKVTFKEVRRWSPQRVAKRRRVWLKVFRIPLHVWDEPLFKLLGSKFGTFEDFDEDTVGAKRLDVGRILVATPRMGLIDEHISISVVGAVYTLWVVEEGCSHALRNDGVEAGGEVDRSSES